MAQSALKLVGKDDGDKQRALEAAMAQIDRAFGKGSVMKLGEKGKIRRSSRSRPARWAWTWRWASAACRKGRIVEIYGPESSGKTTLALHVVAEVQKAGGTAAFVDAEHALDPSYAHKLGVNLDDLLVSQPDTGEQALEITDTLVRSGAVDIIVIDSVAALTPRAEIEGEMGDSLPGLQARLMSQALRKLTASISKSHTLVIFINQIRMKIGVMYGSPGDDHRRQCAEVLRLGPPRHPPHRLGQGPRRDRRQQRPGQGGQEQGRPAVPRGRVRHHVRRGHLQAGRDHRPGRQGRDDREVRLAGSPSTASGSARAATTCASS